MRSYDILTPREHDVMIALIRGRTNREIAVALMIAEKTVEAHLRNIYGKTGATNRVEAALWYLRAVALESPANLFALLLFG